MDVCSLNARDVRHGQGFNEEDSLVVRKTLTIGRMPASIRVNVTDVKAVRPLSLEGHITPAEQWGYRRLKPSTLPPPDKGTTRVCKQSKSREKRTTMSTEYVFFFSSFPLAPVR